ncbi:hypothetical protein BDZ94DRAFT_1214614 [Collybia nuda]|uniref:Uncharacterized protein n=1 Tax=Collybia nuda TaxID=64659 RepID=A0A9P5YCP0_9AGAR|nr:hypothetical protein BDZ94DRAFT_1214614 [Collybia nuda]
MEHHRPRAPPSFEPPSTFSAELAILIAIWVEVLFYGIYTCLFFESLYIMFKKRKARTCSGKVFLVAILLMYIIATVDIALNLYRMIQAYIWLRDSVGPVFYLLDMRRWDNIAHNLNLCFMTWLGDALVIYRCFIIWNRSYLVILVPSLLLIFSIAVNVVIMFWLTHPFSVSFMGLITWMDMVYPVNLAQNILTTGLIAFKILYQHRISTAAGVRRAGSRLRLIHIVRILVESAMVYTFQVLILMILYFRLHNAQFIVQYAIIPTIGIVFNLIAVRIHMTEFGSTHATRTDILTGMSRWADESTATELEGDLTHQTDEEVPRIRLKQLGTFAAEEVQRCHSGSVDVSR